MRGDVLTFPDDLFERYPRLSECRGSIGKAFELLERCFRAGGKALVCGNGGGAADAEHIAGELMKGFALPRRLTEEQAARLRDAFPEGWEPLAARLQRALPTIPLASHSAVYTAVCNDTSADMAFAQQVFGYGKAGDALIALSTSGNAVNVINAATVARAFGLSVIGITGRGGGALAPLCDAAIRVPETETYRIQELTLPVYHALCLMLEQAFFGEEKR